MSVPYTFDESNYMRIACNNCDVTTRIPTPFIHTPSEDIPFIENNNIICLKCGSHCIKTIVINGKVVMG